MMIINLDRMRLGGSFGSSTSSTSALRPYLSYADTSLQLFNQVIELHKQSLLKLVNIFIQLPNISWYFFEASFYLTTFYTSAFLSDYFFISPFKFDAFICNAFYLAPYQLTPFYRSIFFCCCCSNYFLSKTCLQLIIFRSRILQAIFHK